MAPDTKLYASVLLDDNGRFDSFVQNLDTRKLDDTHRDELEGEITLKECRDILRTFSSGKSPGDDGFAWEFYNYFFDLLGQDLVSGGGIEARPGTEKRCSHNLQSGPVKTWTAVSVIINISDRRSTYLK